MSLRRQRSAPMLNVEATGSMLIDPIGAGSARPPTSTVTPPYYPPKTSRSLDPEWYFAAVGRPAAPLGMRVALEAIRASGVRVGNFTHTH